MRDTMHTAATLDTCRRENEKEMVELEKTLLAASARLAVLREHQRKVLWSIDWMRQSGRSEVLNSELLELTKSV